MRAPGAVALVAVSLSGCMESTKTDSEGEVAVTRSADTAEAVFGLDEDGGIEESGAGPVDPASVPMPGSDARESR